MTTNPIAPAQPIAVSSVLSPGYYYFANVDPPTLELMWSDMADDDTGFEYELNGVWSSPLGGPDTSEYFLSPTRDGWYYYQVRSVTVVGGVTYVSTGTPISVYVSGI